MIDKYGADALRFTMAQLASGGRDIKIGPAKVEATRNFITKIWNAARFLEMNDVHYDPDFTPGTAKGSVNQWIIQETLTMLNDVSQEISAYRFDLASKALYQFFWGTYCDIYVECLKSLFADDALQNESKKTAMWVFISFLNVLNPFMPIVTECLFEEFVGQGTLMQKPFILNNNEKIPSDVSEVNWAVQFIQEVRSLKGLLGLSQGNKAQLISREKSADNLILQKNWAWISHLARLDKIVSDGNGVPFVVNGSAFELMIGQEISLDELQKLLKDKACLLDIERKHLQKKLENEAFKIAKPDLWQSDNDLCIIKDSEYTKIKNILEGMNII
jgi:valyl-tRNA synthetase